MIAHSDVRYKRNFYTLNIYICVWVCVGVCVCIYGYIYYMNVGKRAQEKWARKKGAGKMGTGKKGTSEKLGKKGHTSEKDRYNVTQ